MAETKNDEIAIAAEAVMNQIFNIRGHKAMLDFHLAVLYKVENRVLKQAVRRKQQRFPEIIRTVGQINRNRQTAGAFLSWVVVLRPK